MRKIGLEKREKCRKMYGTDQGWRGKAYRIWKRCMDIACAGIACVLLFLPSLLIAVIIRMTSEGPAIYAQERLGMDGKAFKVYKFRTMHMNAEPNGPQLALPDDYRCTSVGAFLRRTRIDEWPQFWNVLTGDMSIVGPRPERAYFYDQFADTIPLFKKRLQVKPGLTGYAQVYGGLYLKPEEKIQYDLYYIEHSGAVMDMRCILKTVFVVTKILFCGDDHG